MISYIDFSAELDNSTANPVITLTDTGTYPTSPTVIASQITGIFTITFPDGSVRQGDWSNPDVTWNGSSLTPKSIAMTLAANGLFQLGTYTIRYEIDHPDYLPTVLTKSFSLSSYSRPTISFDKNFDVFTPELTITDDTSYIVSGLTFQGVTRAWSSVIGTVATITGTSATLDLKYTSYYYDARYVTTLTSIATWVMSSYSWVTIKDRIIGTSTDDIYSAPTLSVLRTGLQGLKTNVDNSTCNNNVAAKSNFVYAMSIYELFLDLGRAGIYDPLEAYLNELQTIFNNYVTPIRTHTNQPLTNIPYDFGQGAITGSISVQSGVAVANIPGKLVTLTINNTTVTLPEAEIVSE